MQTGLFMAKTRISTYYYIFLLFDNFSQKRTIDIYPLLKSASVGLSRWNTFLVLY
jgi:hypothetical protein